ncbi:MAG TPA: DUF3489 domain-containing protein [Bryobacteraceae bacterium]|jgi:hypothetical protein
MTTFTIDSENNLIVHAGVPASADHQQLFATERELAKLAADWPGARLIEVWNNFAGVAPFDDLKPLKKFTNRQTAVRRIWRAVARLCPAVAPPVERVAPVEKKAERSPAKSQQRERPRLVADDGGTNKKAQVIALMKRPKGATLSQIVDATGWQKHTVRGFVSILGHEGGSKIESAKNAAGERCYRIAK